MAGRQRRHIHFGLTRTGALGLTSFWQRAKAHRGRSVARPAHGPQAAMADVAPAARGGTQAPATIG